MAHAVSASKHKSILDAALNVFLEKGYLGTSMDEIAAKAGVSKQTVYKHFADKDRLFADILLATTGEVEQLVRWTIGEFDSDKRVELILDRLAQRFLGVLMEPRLLRLRRLVIANADRFPELGRSWYEAGFERVLATLADCFNTLKTAGILRVDDPALASQHFVGMLLWIPLNKAMFTGNERPFTDAELRRQAKAATSVFLRAYGTTS
ncbi:MAG: TetR/AcrR family transcriptional regulator [Candidatus Velthaea sp.]|jgi:TetR/AcrR family transcriptional repressor of mexJK operon